MSSYFSLQPRRWGKNAIPDRPPTGSVESKVLVVEPEETKNTILKHLDAINSGPFACGEVLKDAPNPGIHISDHGPLRFPLGPHELERIKNAAASFPVIVPPGKRDKESSPELLRTAQLSSPGIWEVPWYRWKPTNPAWEDTMEKIRKETCAELSLSDDLQLKAMWLTLQEEGASFKQFPPEAPTSESFGYLDIFLPSIHTGGEFTISFGDKAAIVTTSSVSTFDCAYTSRFYDVDTTSETLITGHRVILRYRLGYTSTKTIHSAAESVKNIPPLISLFNSWRLNYVKGSGGVLAYFLDNKYERGHLSQEMLVGRDRLMISQLQEACRDSNYLLYLGFFQKIVFEKTEPSDPDDLDTAWSTTYISELDGTKVSNDPKLWISHVNIVQKDPFKDADPDEKVLEDDDSISHKFQRQVAIFFPRDMSISSTPTPQIARRPSHLNPNGTKKGENVLFFKQAVKQAEKRSSSDFKFDDEIFNGL